MFKISFILIIWLLSCGQKAEPGKPEVKEIILEETSEEPDTSSNSEGAFQWRKWEKPKGFVHLSDKILKHLAKGHVSIDGSYGDINENGILDLVIITGLANEDSLRFSGRKLPRHLLVFLDQKDFSFRNDNAISCNSCCGKTDPYAGHIATTGQFVIKENCQTNKKFRREYRFNYVAEMGDWLLDTIVTETSAFIDENYSLDTMTRKDFGKVALKSFSIQNFRTKHR